MQKWPIFKRQVTPPPLQCSVPAGNSRPYDAARGHRINQAQYLEKRLRNGLFPAAVASMTALQAQMEPQQTLLSMAVSIGCRRV